jgi:hypothetical protein
LQPPGVVGGQLELLRVEFDPQVVALVRVPHVLFLLKNGRRSVRAPRRLGGALLYGGLAANYLIMVSSQMRFRYSIEQASR